jgi:hypothetical protein
MTDRAASVPPPAPINVLFWQDVFVVMDNGRASPRHYGILGDLVLERARRYPGVGMLSIIPANAIPPSDEARTAMNAAIARAEGSLKAICWLVEGGGFQGAMVRAVLTGLRLFGRHTYPTHVTTSMSEALAWILHQLDAGDLRLNLVPAGVQIIERQRANGQFVKAF